MKSLNLGSGFDYKIGMINIDKDLSLKADLHLDLEKGALPFASGSVDYIRVWHILEHLSIPALNKLLPEIERVLCNGGIVDWHSPHFSETESRKWLEHQSIFFMHSKLFEANTNLKNQSIDFTAKFNRLFKPLIKIVGWKFYEEWLAQYWQIIEIRIIIKKEK